MTSLATAPRVVASLTDNAWVRFAMRRLTRFVIAVWVLITASFLMIHLVPGDPVRAALGLTAPGSLVKLRRHELGLNDPLWLQYVHYLRGVFTGRLGTSMTSQLPVSDVISERLPATVELAVLAFLVAVAIAIPLGVAMGVLTRNGGGRRGELVFSSSSVVLGTIPDFLLGVGLVYVFGVHWAGCRLPARALPTPTYFRYWHSPSDQPPSSPGSCVWRWSPCCRPTTYVRRGRSACPRR